MSTNDSTPDPTAGEADLHAKCSDTFGWCSICRPAGRLAAIRRALDDEIANLADDGARLSHSVVRRMEAVLAGYADADQFPCGLPDEPPCCPASPPADDASTPASEGLTEDEREALGDWWESDWPDTKEGAIGSLYAVVATIKADAEAKARADERERIAQAIEALSVHWVPNASRTGWLEAVRTHDAIAAVWGDA